MMATANPGITRNLSCSAVEWQTRIDLAALYRAFVHYGWTDYIYTHLTARVPDEEDTYLINPFGLLFDEICASNLLKVDFDGRLISGDYPVNGVGHLIHTSVLRARSDINFVLHSHTRAGCAVSGMKCGLLPLSQHAMVVLDQVTYHPFALATDEAQECERIVQDLGGKFLQLMHNHGLLACGRSAAEAFWFHYYLEMACKIQVDILASGEETVLPTDTAVEAIRREFDVEQTGLGDEGWPALTRLLERKHPDYKR